ncbi:hypothetical protein J7K25_07125 [bacterium]|nr:hypothetical protein [bacterium]
MNVNEVIANRAIEIFEERLRVVNIGGTSIETRLGRGEEYIFLVIEKLRELTRFRIKQGRKYEKPCC